MGINVNLRVKYSDRVKKYSIINKMTEARVLKDILNRYHTGCNLNVVIPKKAKNNKDILFKNSLSKIIRDRIKDEKVTMRFPGRFADYVTNLLSVNIVAEKKKNK